MCCQPEGKYSWLLWKYLCSAFLLFIYQHRWHLIKFGLSKRCRFCSVMWIHPRGFVWTQMDVAAIVYIQRECEWIISGQQSGRLTRGSVMAWRAMCAVEIEEIVNTCPEAWLCKGHYTWLWNNPAALIYSDDFSKTFFRKTWHLYKTAVHSM